MKFGKYLLEQARPEWRGEYLDYKALKDLIKDVLQHVEGRDLPSYSPRTTSLTVQRAADVRDDTEEKFFQRLEAEVDKVGVFTLKLVSGLRERLARLQAASAQLDEARRQGTRAGGESGGASAVAAGGEGLSEPLLAGEADAEASPAPPTPDAEPLLAEARAIGDEFLALEKYVNLNYMGFHKILKKHDKALPSTPCRQFYISHLHQQPWVQGNYSDLLVLLSAIYSRLRGDAAAPATARAAAAANAAAATSAKVVTTKYWVRTSDVSAVKHHILQHLPVWVPPTAARATDGASATVAPGPAGLRDTDALPGAGAAAPADSDDSEEPHSPTTSAGRPPPPPSDTRLVSCVYLDNSSLELYHARLDKRPKAVCIRLKWEGEAEPGTVRVERQVTQDAWNGEETAESSFELRAGSVGAYLEGALAPTQAAALSSRGLEPAARAEVEAAARAVAREVDTKQLRPVVRTQCLRSEFRMPFDASARATLDLHVTVVKEGGPEEGRGAGSKRGGDEDEEDEDSDVEDPEIKEQGASGSAAPGAAAGASLASLSRPPGLSWLRDPRKPLARTEVSHFPHAVLEISLAPDRADDPPAWIQDLLESGLLTEVSGFSKFMHGVASLYPDMVQAVPYWIDDESVRASVLASAPERPAEVAPTARDLKVQGHAKTRSRFMDLLPAALGGGGSAGRRGKKKGGGAAAGDASAAPEGARHPLLGDAPTLRLLPRPGGAHGRDEDEGPKTLLDRWFEKPPMQIRASLPAGTLPGKPEPKTYFANERTFLSWLHMAVTIGSISAALLGFSTAAGSGKKPVPADEREPMQLVAIILLPVAILLCAYALLVYGWRSQQIAAKTFNHIDDRRGPLALSFVLVGALSLIFLISLADLVAAFFERPGPPPPTPPAAAPATGPLPASLDRETLIQLGRGARAVAGDVARALGRTAFRSQRLADGLADAS